MCRVLFALVFLFSACVQAAPVSWSLDNVVLEDSSPSQDQIVVTGSFTYDADGGIYSDIDIQTTGTGVFGAYDFAAGDITGSGADFFAVVEPNGPADLTGEPLLLLVFQESLTNAGGIVLVDLPSLPSNIFATQLGLCSDAACSGGSGPPSAWAISGSVTAVPIPAAVWLFGAALASLGFARRQTVAP